MGRRKWMSVLLVLLLIFTGMPFGIYTDAAEDSMTGEVLFDGKNTDYLINPLYDGLTLEHFPELAEAIRSPAYGKYTTYITYGTYRSTVESAALVLRNAMIDREDTIIVSMSNAVFEELSKASHGPYKELFYAACSHDRDDPRAGDYLRYTYGGWSVSATSTAAGVQMTYYMEYYTTAEEEAQVSAIVDALTAEWKVMDLTQYQQVCAIYDYITENVEYDYDGAEAFNKALSAGTLTMDHCRIFTAYAALTEGTSVCQGYASLFYRLALEMGLDARNVKSVPVENHVWNITALDGLYYNLDATWDAGQKESGYRYFLKNMADFVNHTRHAEYDAAFDAAYPMAETSYVPTVPGDANGDGTVDAEDLQCLRCVLAGIWTGIYSEGGADANGDGRISGADIVRLRQYLAGRSVTLGK